MRPCGPERLICMSTYAESADHRVSWMRGIGTLSNKNPSFDEDQEGTRFTHARADSRHVESLGSFAFYCTTVVGEAPPVQRQFDVSGWRRAPPARRVESSRNLANGWPTWGEKGPGTERIWWARSRRLIFGIVIRGEFCTLLHLYLIFNLSFRPCLQRRAVEEDPMLRVVRLGRFTATLHPRR